MSEDSLGQLGFPGLACWLPVALDVADLDQSVDAVLAEIGHPGPDDRDLAATVLAWVHQVAGSTDPDHDDVLSLVAWLHLAQYDRFTPDAVAWLRIIRRIEPGQDAFGMLAWLCSDSELLETPELTPLETPMGEAATTIVRAVARDDEDRTPYERCYVIWMRPDAGFALVLSVHLVDLLMTERVAHQLRELAAGMTLS